MGTIVPQKETTFNGRGTIVPQKEATFNGRDLIRWVLKKRQPLMGGTL